MQAGRLLWVVALAALSLAPPLARAQMECAMAALLSPPPPSAAELPLCGNGRLDPGEVCDDGNRAGGDGCNAWCSQFDLMAPACTVAGAADPCPAGQPALDAPARSAFCALSALAVAPDGAHLFLADGGLLLRMPLFADPALPVTRLRAAADLGAYTRFCSLHALPEGLLAHECAAQTVLLFSPDGTGVTVLASLRGDLAPAAQGRAFYDAEARELLLAGVPAAVQDLACVRLLAVPLDGSPPRAVGAVPCEVFGAWDGGTLYTSFSAQGMRPTQVLREPCLAQMAALDCYVVDLQRDDDLQTMAAYVPRAGGDDLHYTVSADPTANVLGATLRVRSADGRVLYAATGGCLAAQDTASLVGGHYPPRVVLGAACPTAPRACWTPLLSPFNTDVVASPYPLPSGLSVRHTHAQLATIFSVSADEIAAQLRAARGSLLSGMPLYRQILANTYEGTAPVAFAEIPTTRDLVYITRTTVGLVGTKGYVVSDVNNPGYCLATRLRPCPVGAFGEVGGECAPCGPDARSVAAQVQCQSVATGGAANASSRRLLQALGGGLLSVQLTAVVSRNVTLDVIDAATAYYALASGAGCPPAGSTSLTPHQPYNWDADTQESGAPSQNLTSLLIQAAERATARRHSVPDSAEYLVTWTAPNVDLLAAAAAAGRSGNVSDAGLAACTGREEPGLAQRMNRACFGKLNHRFATDALPCLVQAVVDWRAGRAPPARRLLQQPAPDSGGGVLVLQQAGPSLLSSVPLDFSAHGPPPPPPPPAERPAAAPDRAPLVVGLVAGVAGLLLLVTLLYVALRRRGGRERRVKRL